MDKNNEKLKIINKKNLKDEPQQLNKNEISLNKHEGDILIKYKVDKNSKKDKLRIFGEKFVQNNKGKCTIFCLFPYLYDKELVVYLNYSEIKCADIIEISLKGINNITDMSDMFEGCDS